MEHPEKNPIYGSDVDPEETAEWIESFEGLISSKGPERARDMLATPSGDRPRRPERPLCVGLEHLQASTPGTRKQGKLLESRRRSRVGARGARNTRPRNSV